MNNINPLPLFFSERSAYLMTLQYVKSDILHKDNLYYANRRRKTQVPLPKQTINMMNNETIHRRLGEIESANNVRILFAAESGSRAWGFSSPDSDYDVRFIYVHPFDWYLTITPGRDTIERLDADGFDASGWDIRKALGLFSKTNLTMIEWINSPIIYSDDNVLRPALLALLPVCFNKTRALSLLPHSDKPQEQIS